MLVIPAIQEAEIGRISAQGQPGKMLARPHLSKKPDVLVHICNQSQVHGSIGRRIVVQGQPQAKSVRSYLKITKQKRSGVMV
jgi:hypothetical protein